MAKVGRKVKYTIEDCIKISKQRNGKCLSVVYVNANKYLSWECKFGHKWDATFGSILLGNWCPDCSNRRKHTIEQCKEFAKSKNGECLSDDYVGAHSVLVWKCFLGHIWKASFADVKNQKHWCHTCGGSKRKTIEDCKTLAQKHNGKCLSLNYTNNRIKMLWECNVGHIFEMKYDKVHQNQWCPECSDKYKTQKHLISIVREIFKEHEVRSNFNRFTWLYNKKTNGLQSIDIYVVGLKIAIEYDGEQHFRPVQFDNISFERAELKFERQKQLDKLKDKNIKQHPEDVKFFVRFNYKEKNKLNIEYVIDKLRRIGVEGL